MSAFANDGFDRGVDALESEDYPAAISAFKNWLSEHPEDVDAWHNLGVAQFYLSRFQGALSSWQKALKLSDNQREVVATVLNAGDELQSIYKKPLLAAPFFRLLLQHPKHGLTATLRLAYCLRYSNQAQEALELLQKAQQKYPLNLALKLQETFLLPVVYDSAEEMNRWHDHFCQSLNELQAWLKTPENLGSGPTYLYSPIFDIMALGRNDKTLLQQVSQVWRQVFVPKNMELIMAPKEAADKPNKLRLGIVSGTVYNHSTMHYFHGMFEQLAQVEDIESGLFYFGERQDSYTRHMSSLVHHFLQMPMDIVVGVEAISKWQPDVLFYLDIGLESLLYTLAHLRLAPVQCVSAGVPMTTGIDTMDYYLSSRWFEPPHNAAENYSETLVCLDDLMVNMRPPRQNNPLKTRRELNLPEDKHLYIFPHSLIRVDPELDAILAQILQRDPLALVYFVQDPKNETHNYVLQRFQKKYASLAERIHFLPWMNQADFLNVIACCNVALDSLRLGGGNVTFQSLYMGTPMIQCPTEQLRCRIASGLYMLLDMPEWIAQDWDDYLEKALQLGTNHDLRQQVSAQLLAGRTKIFNQTAGVEAILDHFRAWGGYASPSQAPPKPIPLKE